MDSISEYFRFFSYQLLDSSGPAISGTSRDNPYNEPAPVAACRAGDLGCLEREIQKDSSIVYRDYLSGKTGNTVSLLVIAVAGRHVELTRLLIDKGADVNYALKDGSTTLLYAAQRGLLEIARLLIDNGADVNQATNNGATPLYYAAQEGHREIVKLLLANDADPNKQCKMLSMGRFSITRSSLFAARFMSRDKKEAAEMIETAIKERKINSSTEFPVTAQNLVGNITETSLQPGKINKEFPKEDFLPTNFEQLQFPPLLAGQHASYGTIR